MPPKIPGSGAPSRCSRKKRLDLGRFRVSFSPSLFVPRGLIVAFFGETAKNHTMGWGVY
jgi:hypothetical protein